MILSEEYLYLVRQVTEIPSSDQLFGWRLKINPFSLSIFWFSRLHGIKLFSHSNWMVQNRNVREGSFACRSFFSIVLNALINSSLNWAALYPVNPITKNENPSRVMMLFSLLTIPLIDIKDRLKIEMTKFLNAFKVFNIPDDILMQFSKLLSDQPGSSYRIRILFKN